MSCCKSVKGLYKISLEYACVENNEKFVELMVWSNKTKRTHSGLGGNNKQTIYKIKQLYTKLTKHIISNINQFPCNRERLGLNIN